MDVSAGMPWGARLDALLAHPDRLTLALQPVVDVVAQRVAGFEALTRVAEVGPDPTRGPADWFAAAVALDRHVELDRLVLTRTLRTLDDLPHGLFLTFNVTPSTLLDDAYLDDLLAGDRRGLVLEVTEHADVDSADLADPLDRWRERGGLVALDDVGAGHSGLLRMALTRPDLIKIDLRLIRGVEDDLTKRAVVQLVGECAGRLDAWVVAEGVETLAELDVLQGMGIPLLQGYLLGRPADDFARLGPAARRLLRPGAPARPAPDGSRERAAVGRLARRTKTARDLVGARASAEVEGVLVVLLDERDVPLALLVPEPGGARVVADLTTVDPGARVTDVAVRAVSRRPADRWDPVVCTDTTGRYVGIVGVEDLVIDLVRGAEGSAVATPTPTPEPAAAGMLVGGTPALRSTAVEVAR